MQNARGQVYRARVIEDGEDVLKRGDGGSGSALGPHIEWEIRGPGPIGPRVAPFFVCSTCGERITRGDANALFERNGKGGRTGRFVVVHRKPECDAPWNNARRWWEWQRLDALLIQLLHNSGYDLEALAARQDQLRALRAEVLDDPDREPKSFREAADYLDAGLWTIG